MYKFYIFKEYLEKKVPEMSFWKMVNFGAKQWKCDFLNIFEKNCLK